MLGQTTKWLRLMGIDTEYASEGDDEDILKIARDEGRVIVTRDKELAREEGVFLAPKEPATKVIPLILSIYQVEVRPMSRCSKCNSVVEEVEKSAVERLVPEGVLSWCDDYWRCTGCGQVYWKGSHWDDIIATIEEMVEGSK